MKEPVKQNNNIKPKGILLTLMGIIVNFMLILIASTLILIFIKLIQLFILNSFGFPELNTLIKSVLFILKNEIIKLKLFLRSLPTMVLIILLFFVDGLVQRDIRKFQCARESTFLFHRSKPYISFCFYSSMFIYFISPALINPEMYFMVLSIVLGIVIHFSVKHFKKYV